MKNILKILIFVLFIASGCTLSDGRFGNPGYVEVKRGDTLYSISRKYNVPLREVIEINKLKPPYSLRVGQIIRLPSNRYHIVEKGDTLYAISRKYNVDVNSLSRANNLRPPYSLSVGDRLTLPGSIGASSYNGSQSSNSNRTSSYNKSTGQKTNNYQPKTSSSYSTPSPSVAAYKRSVKFSWPVRGPIISKYGTLGKGRKNDGINIKAAAGTAVNAADKGIVVYAGNELRGFGNLILIKHSDGWITAYAHNERIFVRKGQSVRRGEKISAVGTTGGVNTPQLHFEIHVNKKPINPMPYLQ